MSRFNKVLKENPEIWKSESALLNFMRGGLRRALWEKNPIKLKFIKENRQRIPNPNPRGRVETVWGGECNVCKSLFPQSDLQVDHKRSDFNKLTDMNDLQGYVENMALVSKDELQLVCKPCHGIISHSQRKGISFEEARIEKEIIALCKDDKKVVDKLLVLGVELSNIPNTKKAKKELLTKLMTGEGNE